MYPFKPGSFAPRNGWCVAAFRNEIGEELLSRWILNQPVVLYRKADGKCTFMPSQRVVPGVYSIRAYPLVERGLWAWIWPGDAAAAAP